MLKLTRLALLTLLILVAILTYPGTSTSQEDNRDMANVVLYAYLNEHLTILDGKVLGVSPTWGELIKSNATIENLFTLYPALGGDLRVRGTVIFKGWLRADRVTFGRLVMTLYEKTNEGDQLQVTSVEGFVAVTPRRSEYTFGVAGLEYTFNSGSTIQFELVFYPSEERHGNVYLEWNDPKAQTRVILPCIGHIKGVSSLWNLEEDKRLGNLISLNESKVPFETSLRVNITDVFGIDDVKSVNLTLKDILGIKIVENEPMTLVSYGSQLYNAVYVKNLTLSKGIRIAEITILDSAGNIHKLMEEFHLTYYYLLKIKVKDGEGRAISNATYRIANGNAGLIINGSTGKDGLILYPLPASNAVGSYDLNIRYRGMSIKLPDIKINSPIYKEIEFPLYLLKVKIVAYGIPLYRAKVSIWNGSTPISSGSTDLSGRIKFDEIPLGNYSMDIRYLLQTYRTDLNFREHGREYEIDFNPPLFRIGPWILILGIATTLSLRLISKKRERIKVSDFKYFDKLFVGRLPEALSVMILGPPGSGKTATLESFVKRFLQEGRRCIYISNTGFPEETRRSLKGFSVPVEKFEEDGKLLFIDCYSSIAGRESKERHFIESPGDLTRLGIEITTCLESSKGDADLFFDSLSQLSTYVKPDHLLSFINTIGARMKDNNGRFMYTVGSNIEPELLGMMEEASDCIIELMMRDRDGIQERSLRIKKFRGKRHSSRWIRFEVHPDEGVVFITKHRLF